MSAQRWLWSFFLILCYSANRLFLTKLYKNRKLTSAVQQITFASFQPRELAALVVSPQHKVSDASPDVCIRTMLMRVGSFPFSLLCLAYLSQSLGLHNTLLGCPMASIDDHSQDSKTPQVLFQRTLRVHLSLTVAHKSAIF